MDGMTPDHLGLGARQSTRVPTRVPVRLGIKEEKGTFRTLVAWTLVLSKQGARIEGKQALHVNQEVIVTVLPSEERSGIGEVILCESKRSENGNFEFGVELREAENLWGNYVSEPSLTFPYYLQRRRSYLSSGTLGRKTLTAAWVPV